MRVMRVWMKETKHAVERGPRRVDDTSNMTMGPGNSPGPIVTTATPGVYEAWEPNLRRV